MTGVLVAEDDPDVRELVIFKLEQAGYDVVGVADGPAVIRAVAEHRPDLVLLDISMPGMSGLDVCRQLRADPASAATRIMLLTARAQEHDVTNGFAAGADDYLVKPFSPRELAGRVQALLTATRSRET